MRVDIFGAGLDCVTFEEAVATVHRIVASGGPVQHAAINSWKLYLMDRDAAFRDLVNGCELLTADGQSMVWAARLLGHHVPERVTGIDLMNRLLNDARVAGWRVYFFGAEADVVAEVAAIAARSGVRVAGHRSGFWREEGYSDADVVRDIAAARADILFVALPSPLKERWLSTYLTDLHVAFAMGVGGSFDVMAGRLKRAPRWMQVCGLEWFYRLSQEPRRLLSRYATSGALLLTLVTKHYWTQSWRRLGFG